MILTDKSHLLDTTLIDGRISECTWSAIRTTNRSGVFLYEYQVNPSTGARPARRVSSACWHDLTVAFEDDKRIQRIQFLGPRRRTGKVRDVGFVERIDAVNDGYDYTMILTLQSGQICTCQPLNERARTGTPHPLLRRKGGRLQLAGRFE